MKAALALTQSLTTLQSHTDFISHFLLPLFCHSWAKLLGSRLLPGLWFQAKGMSAWKAANECECHHRRLGAKKKQQLTTTRRTQDRCSRSTQSYDVTHNTNAQRLVLMSSYITTLSMAQDTVTPSKLPFQRKECTPGGRETSTAYTDRAEVGTNIGKLE